MVGKISSSRKFCELCILNKESYTSLLWIFEGFTSYYDDLILLRSGVINGRFISEILKEQDSIVICKIQAVELKTVAESSFHASLKFIVKIRTQINAGTSYYNKGCLVALCLDLGLRLRGSSLDALMRKLFENAQNGIQVNERTISIYVMN